MIIKKLSDNPFEVMEDHVNIKKQVVIGPDDGSNEIVLRYFKLAPGEAGPHRQDDFPHLVKVETGKGTLTGPDGNEHPLSAGDYVYVHDNEPHCFKNNGPESFELICVVPSRGEE